MDARLTAEHDGARRKSRDRFRPVRGMCPCPEGSDAPPLASTRRETLQGRGRVTDQATRRHPRARPEDPRLNHEGCPMDRSSPPGTAGKLACSTTPAARSFEHAADDHHCVSRGGLVSASAGLAGGGASGVTDLNHQESVHDTADERAFAGVRRFALRRHEECSSLLCRAVWPGIVHGRRVFDQRTGDLCPCAGRNMP